MGSFISREEFLDCPHAMVAELVAREGRPKLGVFVPDGSRRLVMAMTSTEPGTRDFYRACATLPAEYLLASIKAFFEHGVHTLLVPILSQSVFERGSDYRRYTALEGLKLLFSGEAWRDFYDKYQVRVRVYGQPTRLSGTECAEALPDIESTLTHTAHYSSHTLFYGIGENPHLGLGIAEDAVFHSQRLGRPPTVREQIETYYGEPLPVADFYIMTSKMSGLGVLPRFLVNSDTEVYFLPSAGAIGLNTHTIRSILYDLLFIRPSLKVDMEALHMSLENRSALGTYYGEVADMVVGLGQVIGGVWTLQPLSH